MGSGGAYHGEGGNQGGVREGGWVPVPRVVRETGVSNRAQRTTTLVALAPFSPSRSSYDTS
jgi:hypothetical protein